MSQNNPWKKQIPASTHLEQIIVFQQAKEAKQKAAQEAKQKAAQEAKRKTAQEAKRNAAGADQNETTRGKYYNMESHSMHIYRKGKKPPNSRLPGSLQR